MRRLVGSGEGRGEVDRNDRAGVRGNVAVDLREVGRRRLRRLGLLPGHRETRVELGRADRHLVEVVLGTEEDAHGDHPDPELLEERRGQVAGRVGDDPDALRAILVEARLVLGPHVLDLGLRDLGELPGDGKHLLRLVGVNVEAHARDAPGDHDRVAEQRRLAPQRVAVDVIPLEQRLGAIAEEDLLRRPVEDGGPGVLRGRLGDRAAGRLAKVADDPLEQVDERLGPGVDDAGLLQRRHLSRRLRQGDLRPLQGLGQEFFEVRDIGRAGRDVPRPVADDRQDRPLDGPRDGLVRRVGRPHDGLAEIARRNARPVGQPLGEPAEELREDRAGVAPRPSHGLVRERARHLAHVPLAQAGDSRGRLLEGRGHVGPRVAVGDRKHVDLVERLGAVGDESRPRDDGTGEAPAVEVSDGDHGLMGAGSIAREGSVWPWRSLRYSSAIAGSRSR